MRHYQPIWEAIKKKNHASLVAPVSSHKRIIKAVIKEKNKDEGYKLLLSEKCLRATLIISYDPNNKDLLMFSLAIKILPKYIGVNDL